MARPVNSGPLSVRIIAGLPALRVNLRVTFQFGVLSYPQVASAEGVSHPVHGLTTDFTVRRKSASFLVTSVRLWTSAVAAISASIAWIGRPLISRRATTLPHSLAISSLTGITRPSNRNGSPPCIHSSNRLRRSPAGSRSTPRRSSAIVTTLRNTRSSSTSVNHAVTAALGLTLVHSDTTLVSKENLIYLRGLMQN